MKIKVRPTNHFLKRLWERGFYQCNIEKITKGISVQNQKTIFLFSYEILKAKGVEIDKNEYLIIVVKGNLLVTIFTIKDIWEYLKTQQNCQFIFNPLN